MFFKVVLENGKTYLHVTDETGTTVTENELIISVKNEPGAALPKTGGPGTSLFYLLGIMLTFFAGAALVRKKRLA